MKKDLFLNLGARLAVLPLLLPSVALAADAPLKGLDGAQNSVTAIGTATGTGGTTASLPTLIGRGINVVLGVLGIVFVLMVVYAGVLYLTDGGAGENVKKAKKLLTQSIIGMVIIIAAYSISNFVIAQLIGVTTA